MAKNLPDLPAGTSHADAIEIDGAARFLQWLLAGLRGDDIAAGRRTAEYKVKKGIVVTTGRLNPMQMLSNATGQPWE